MSADERIDRIPQTFNLQDLDEVDVLLKDARVAPDLSEAQRERMSAVVKGQLIPEPLYSAQDLIGIATRLKQPAQGVQTEPTAQAMPFACLT